MAIIAEIVAQLPVDPATPLRLAEYCEQVLVQSEAGFIAEDVMNLDTAFQAAQQQERDDLYISIATKVAWLFENTGHLDLLERTLHTALSMSSTTTQWALITVHLARAMWLRERSDIALQMLQEAGEIAAATSDPDLVGIASRILADVHFERDDLASAVFHVHRAGSAWDASESAKAKARVEAAALRSYMLNPRFDALRTMLARALPVGMAERVDSVQFMLGVIGKGWLDFLAGDTDAGLSQLVRALAISEERSHRVPALFALGALAWANAVLGDYDKARQYGERAAYAPDRDRLPDFAVLAYSALGMTALAHGHTDEVLNVLRDGLDYSVSQGADAMGAGLHGVLAQWYLAEGNLREAWAHSETGYSLARAWRFTLVSVNSLSLMGAVASRRHEYDKARQHFMHALREGRLDAPKANPWVNTLFRRHYADFLLASGNTNEATVQYIKAVAIAKALRAGEFTGEALSGLANAQLVSGHRDTAKATALESLSVLRGIGHVGADAVSRWMQQIE